MRAHEVYEAVGLGFIEEVSSVYPKEEDSIEPQILLERLEEVVPGFLDWAQVFGDVPDAPQDQIEKENAQINIVVSLWKEGLIQ